MRGVGRFLALGELQADGVQGGAIIGQQGPGDPSQAVLGKPMGPSRRGWEMQAVLEKEVFGHLSHCKARM